MVGPVGDEAARVAGDDVAARLACEVEEEVDG